MCSKYSFLFLTVIIRGEFTVNNWHCPSISQSEHIRKEFCRPCCAGESFSYWIMLKFSWVWGRGVGFWDSKGFSESGVLTTSMELFKYYNCANVYQLNISPGNNYSSYWKATSNIYAFLPRQSKYMCIGNYHYLELIF